MTALVSLGAFAILALAVSHAQGPDHLQLGALKFERYASPVLSPSPAAGNMWADVAYVLGVPAIVTVLIAGFVYGAFRRVLKRTVFYGALAAGAFLVSEKIMNHSCSNDYRGTSAFPPGTSPRYALPPSPRGWRSTRC
jgi:hypothetical protein